MDLMNVVQSPVTRTLNAAWHAYVEADACLRSLEPHARTADREAAQQARQAAFEEYRRAAAAFDHLFFLRLACALAPSGRPALLGKG
jgi:hypothetical protein